MTDPDCLTNEQMDRTIEELARHTIASSPIDGQAGADATGEGNSRTVGAAAMDIAADHVSLSRSGALAGSN